MNRTEYIGKLNALYVGEKNCLEELITIYDEKDKEIERLKERIEDLNTINEEHRMLNGMIRKELQQKENIIKEVRELKEDKKIEKIQQRTDTGLFGSMINDEIKVAEAINKQANYLSDIVSTINEIIDKLNEMEKE